jgi:subtilisin family serine protease
MEPYTSITPPSGTTGRYLVLFKEGVGAAGIRSLSKAAKLSIASTSDFESGVATMEGVSGADGLLFPDLGVAVVDTPPEQIRGVGIAADSGILAVEPERIVFAISDAPASQAQSPLSVAASTPSLPLEYLRGYRDAVNQLCDKLMGPGVDLLAEGAMPILSEVENTWGLQATKVPASRFTGQGIKVAVLDTGLDLGHPDYSGRQITSASFVVGQTVQDGNGHGTHCIGTACGPRQPGVIPRYGVAFDAEIFAGKVLSNQGSGGDAGILAGIQWAITNGCAIVSMSLGAPTQIGQPHSQIFEQVAGRALAAGTAIIAAAGNDSERPHHIAPVSHPANCPSIMAVAAVDRNMQIARFSCGGLNPQGGQVDIAGPGVDVRSTWPRPTLYHTISGTSMATPHVAGIAALWAQSDASFRGRALLNVLTQSARRLTLPARDIGAGLVQAP